MVSTFVGGLVAGTVATFVTGIVGSIVGTFEGGLRGRFKGISSESSGSSGVKIMLGAVFVSTIVGLGVDPTVGELVVTSFA
jgi:hypothetical protein